MTPPLLLPTRRHQSLASSARHIYSALVRTRPFPSKTRRQNVHTPTPGIWGSTCGRGLVKLVYRSTGVWAVLGVSYVVGLVAGPIAGSAVSSSLLVAAVTSILTGTLSRNYIELSWGFIQLSIQYIPSTFTHMAVKYCRHKQLVVLQGQPLYISLLFLVNLQDR